MKKLTDQQVNKKNIILLFCVIAFVASSIAFTQYQQDNTIVGTWVSVDDLNNKWVFTNDSKTKWYYKSELLETFTYKTSTSSPQCGVSVQEYLQKHPDVEILKLTSQQNGDEYCYYITTLNNENLSLAPFGKGGFLTFDRQ